MKKALRIGCLLLALIMLVTAFAGCGKKDGNGDDKGGSTELTGASLKWADMFGEEYVSERAAYEKDHPPYQVPEELKGTTVKFATWIDHTTTEAKYAMQNFEKVTGIKVEWVQTPQGSYFDKIATAVASGTAPDVYVENNEFFPNTLKVSKPLDEVKSIDMNDPIWDKGYFDFTTFGGHTYQLNARNSLWQTVNLLFYNKKAFDENGIKTPQDYIDEDNWTVESMTQIMRDFKALNATNAGGYIAPYILAQTYGSEIVYLKDGKFVSGLGDAALEKAFKYYLSGLKEGIMNGSQASMLKGTSAFYSVDSFGLKPTGYFKGVESDVLGFAPMPPETVGGDFRVPSHYRAYGIVSAAQNPEGAGYFLRYFLDPYNYNWDEAFLNEEAKEFYLKECANIDFNKKAFGFQFAVTTLLGYSGHDDTRKWDYALMRTSEAQLLTTMQSISSEVNAGVDKANEVLAGLK